MIDHIQKQLCLTIISKKIADVQEKPALPDVPSIYIVKKIIST